MPFESNMRGTPEELMARASKARAQQRQTGGAWSPALDALESFAYQSPVEQNRAYADMAQSDAPGPLSDWSKYGAVLNARGAQLNPKGYAAEPGLPAGYTEGQLNTENQQALLGGAAPRWTGSNNLRSSQRRIVSSLKPYDDIKDKDVRASLSGLYRSIK